MFEVGYYVMAVVTNFSQNGLGLMSVWCASLVDGSLVNNASMKELYLQ